MKTILLKSKKAVFSHRHGIFGARRGEGFDFVELAQYDYASDAKRIDWIAFAKSGEVYMKVYEEELSHNIAIVPILSGSLHFGYSRLKIDMLLEAMSLIAYSALLSQEELLIQIEQTKFHPRSIEEIDAILSKITSFNLIGKKGRFDPKSIKLLEPHLLILISDFLDPIDLDGLGFRHDVVAIVLKCTPKRLHTRALTKDPVSLRKRGAELNGKTIALHNKKLDKIRQNNLLALSKKGAQILEIEEIEDIFFKLYHFFGSR